MLVGILSDSHGRVDSTRAAVSLLRERGAEYLIHCGDVGSESILDLLAGETRSAAFVWGNNDWERERLARYAAMINVQCLDVSGTLSLDQKQFAVTHGDQGAIVHAILDAQQHDYLLIGHSHIPADHRMGRTRVINPGALYRAATKTVVLLDTKSDELQLLTVRA